ncbi:hypothetical protein [Rhizobium leguminosarum]|uniref:hypothetical protein n=1 Tax=Rhizobium leguminosarum TaxID=384 RepID=UPI0014429209|nr:hypothetical protein [Rhizobium leguminosarum]NKL04481.1 hypothetical protein [Rhizobium leguminosarum bv. viciae]NKL83986.1 hypothetical protein [Rhizobium leguminosarum bv. viciae]NKL89645.1 hypothetical protein [Rhizobium leguminosarum bv. viciae]NKM90612.1 hypothetical protein [Rhizobium leguminosarum bv. viciae]
MTLFRRVRVLLIAVAVGISGLEVAEQFSIPVPASIVTPAEARVGRPLTPVSVAGVARRTVRRCAVGVYYC